MNELDLVSPLLAAPAPSPEVVAAAGRHGLGGRPFLPAVPWEADAGGQHAARRHEGPRVHPVLDVRIPAARRREPGPPARPGARRLHQGRGPARPRPNGL